MVMTKKHFEVIAKVIREHNSPSMDYDKFQNFIEDLTYELENFNPRFDSDVFMAKSDWLSYAIYGDDFQ